MKEKKDKDKGITAKKEEDMPEWYSQIIIKAEIADYVPVKGCMVLRPNGFSIWENLKNYFNKKIKEKGVRNAYFPLFIPEEFFEKEAEHAEGFKAEVAWIERKNKNEQRYALRPTSETIMYHSYSKWIRSWRDLPLKINQWANIVRWETQDCKLFLRSREFLWQEGHCVYETEKECNRETLEYLELYRKVAEELLAVPVIKGRKTEKEKFAGGIRTYSIEGFMPDGKGLQMGTSHDLGQGFAKAFNIKYIGKDKKEHYPWQNSWGISWRMLGALIMTHSDNKGLVIPPRIAETKAAIIPIYKNENKKEIFRKCREMQKELASAFENPNSIIFDDREEYSPGWKFNEHELKGTPIRIELGPKDLEKETAVLVRRDLGKDRKKTVKLSSLKETLLKELEEMQASLFKKAEKTMKSMIKEAENYDEFKKIIAKKQFALVSFCGSTECEEKIKEDTSATSRNIPIDAKGKPLKPKQKTCFHCAKPSQFLTYFGKSY